MEAALPILVTVILVVLKGELFFISFNIENIYNVKISYRVHSYIERNDNSHSDGR